jgi:DnaJ homolog subfamily C member 19
MGKLLTLIALAALLIAWWRGRSRRMPVGEARALLGVTADDDADAIRAAHRRLIAKVHPDAGGTAELARRTNMARDTLLAELRRLRND